MSDSEFSSDNFDKLLDDFIASQLQDTEDLLTETMPEKDSLSDGQNSTPLPPSDPDAAKLALEERRFYTALTSFRAAVTLCAQNANMEPPQFKTNAKHLLKRFRPTRISEIKHDILTGWEILLAAQTTRLSSLPQNASDEQILNFAEKTTEPNLQNALISYVETLIELDSCEIAYNLRHVKYQKHQIEKQIFEEQQARKEKMRKYIAAIRAQNFPIDAETLVNNFFKTVRKDPEGAKKTLENNPATFAPILFHKIPNKLFGLIKPKPEDGIKINKKIGKFLKKLKA